MDLEWNADRVLAQLDGASVLGLTVAAEHLLQVSRTEVPLDEHMLEVSGVASVDESTLTAAVSYDTPYAVRQHEELTWQHPGNRKAKYLEDPMHAEQDTMLALIATQLRREIGG